MAGQGNHSSLIPNGAKDYRIWTYTDFTYQSPLKDNLRLFWFLSLQPRSCMANILTPSWRTFKSTATGICFSPWNCCHSAAFPNYKYPGSLSQVLQQPEVREGFPGNSSPKGQRHNLHTACPNTPGWSNRSPGFRGMSAPPLTADGWEWMPFPTPKAHHTYQSLLRNIWNPDSHQDPKPSSPWEVPLTRPPDQVSSCHSGSENGP